MDEAEQVYKGRSPSLHMKHYVLLKEAAAYTTPFPPQSPTYHCLEHSPSILSPPQKRREARRNESSVTPMGSLTLAHSTASDWLRDAPRLFESAFSHRSRLSTGTAGTPSRASCLFFFALFPDYAIFVCVIFFPHFCRVVWACRPLFPNKVALIMQGNSRVADHGIRTTQPHDNLFAQLSRWVQRLCLTTETGVAIFLFLICGACWNAKRVREKPLYHGAKPPTSNTSSCSSLATIRARKGVRSRLRSLFLSHKCLVL